MNVRTLAFSAAALGLLAGAAPAKDPVKPAAKPVAKTAETSPVANQQLAEAIGNRLTNTNAAQGADVSIVTDNGVVTVTGPCGSAAQKKAIIDEVRVVAGVKMVRDGMTVGGGVMQAQGVGPMAAQPQYAVPPGGPGMMAMGGPLVEPAPVGMPGAGMGDGGAPPLPNYAWPTYAPHNNVSRVGYPTAYPYNAFPFIGPFYPFPKVPLGWRSVTMTFEDGHWFYGRTSTPQDYWRVRFW